MPSTALATVAAFALAVAVGCTGCASELKPLSEIEPSVSREGTLANQKLISDTMHGLLSVTGGRVTPETEMLRFVIQEPVGSAGSRAWREVWVVQPETAPRASFIITFREVGSFSATFEIREMKN